MGTGTGSIKAMVTINLKNHFALLNILCNNYTIVRQVLILSIRNYLKKFNYAARNWENSSF